MLPFRSCTRSILIPLLVTAALHGDPARFFVRFGGGWQTSGTTTIRDVACGSSTPPALFGCGAGGDGRPLSARGDFRRSAAFETGAGVEATAHLRLELALMDIRRLDLAADSNFTGVSQPQPVSAEVRSRAALFSLSMTGGPAKAPLRPFFGIAAGVSRNTIGPVTYRFPTISSDAVTITTGGGQNHPAFSVFSGVTLRVTDAVLLDLAYRFTDLGSVETKAGPATIVRPTRQLRIDIAGTRAPLKTYGPAVTLRVRF